MDRTEDEIRRGICEVLNRKIDLIAEDVRDLFTSPQRAAVHELERVLTHEPDAADAATQNVLLPGTEVGVWSVFSGNRPFSAEKLASMMEYLLSKGRSVYKTNLNKLLFYSDLTAFYLRGAGISGAVYVNRQYGPVADPAAEVLEQLIESGRIKTAERTRHLITSGDRSADLSDDEIKILDWVLETYGAMGAGEISDLSHLERAYTDTKPNEPIAYAYAQFLLRLPPATILDRKAIELED